MAFAMRYSLLPQLARSSPAVPLKIFAVWWRAKRP
jgi:hypothetical protein